MTDGGETRVHTKGPKLCPIYMPTRKGEEEKSLKARTDFAKITDKKVRFHSGLYTPTRPKGQHKQKSHCRL